MKRTTVKVTPEEMQELKKLAVVVKNPLLPMSQRRIAKSQYEAIIKFAKHQNRAAVSFL
ncbi:hypothetical protein [Cohnella sp.]|uniref:hypothetical protein n=1 Tax=Cohnella sp. TaxID=1883426 RepID=UPI003567D724